MSATPQRRVKVASLASAEWDGRLDALLKSATSIADRALLVAGSQDAAEAIALSNELGSIAASLAELERAAPDRARAVLATHAMERMIVGARAGEGDVYVQLWAAMEIASGRQKGGGRVRVSLPRRHGAALRDAELERFAVVDLEDPNTLVGLAKRARRKITSRSDERVARHAYWTWLHEVLEMSPSAVAEHWRSVTATWHAWKTGERSAEAPSLKRDGAATVALTEWLEAGGDYESLTEERVKQGIAAVRPLRVQPGKG